MKITIERKSFVDALTIGSQMAAKAKGLTVLENSKITIKNNTATISSYDSEVAITKRVNILSHDEDCVFCIEPKALLAILRSLKDEKVDLILDNHICEVVHAKGKQSMPYDDADDFPSPVFDKDMNTFGFKSESLFNWLKEAKSFVGVNTLYPSMMGVYVYCGNNECGVASTNTEVLYYNHEEHAFDGEEVGASLCIKAIDALLPMLNMTDFVDVMIGNRNVVFKTKDAMLVATRTEQPYPNFRRIIPTGNGIELKFNKQDMLDAVKRAMLTANEQSSLLKLSINSMCMKIVSEDIMFAKKTYEECPCECFGGNIEIGLKGNYVLSMLNSIEGEDVLVTMKEPRKPILWYDSLNNAKVLLQMPCQLV